MPPDIGREPPADDMPLDIDERLNEVLGPLIAAPGRALNESEEPPPIRPGMKPSALPP
jgi:hypothetical protein